MKFRAFFLLATLFVAGGLSAQTPKSAAGAVRGLITDASGTPVSSASVAVMSATDSTIAGGALTAADGTFRVVGLQDGSYYLRVSHIAFAPVTKNGVTIAANAPLSDVGPINLKAAVIAVEGVTATADRSDVQLSAERNTYSTRNMPATTGGNVTDVLRNVPAVEVDPDGKVSLRGNNNVAIQINGRAAPARGDQVGQFLQQLPPNMVERVEVVPNPSAKYDPDGMAGIINIVLKSNADLGLSGGFSLAAGTGGRYNASGNLGYQTGPLTLFGTYAFMDDTRKSEGLSARENLFENATSRFINQTSNGTSLSNANTINTSAELKLNEKSSFGSTLMLSQRSYEIGSLNARIARDATGSLLTSWQDNLLNASTDKLFDGTLSFRTTGVSVELRYNRLDVDMNQNTTSTTAEHAESTTRIIDAMNDDLTLNADVTRTVKGARVESGIKAARRRVENNVDDPRLSYSFGTNEDIQAAYTVVTREAGSWEMQGGLRVERTERSYVGTSDEDVSFTNLFPSGLVAYKFGGNGQVKASYSRRIRRPETFMLNSILFYDDALNRQRGNPALRPEYTNAFELGYQQTMSWGSVMINPFLRQTSGAIRMIRSTQGDTTTGVFTNFDDARSMGVDVTTTVRGQGKSAMFGVNSFRHETDGGSVYGSGFGWSARASGNVSITKATDVQASAQYRAPMRVHQGKIGAFGMTNFSVRHKLNGDKAVATLRVTDPFNMMQNRRTTTSMADELPYILESERSFGARGVTLGVSYSFGTTPKLRAPRKQENEGGWEGN